MIIEKCNKVPNNTGCIPQLIVRIQGIRKKKLTKLEAFVLSTILYFQQLKDEADSNRTIEDTLTRFFKIKSASEVIECTIISLIYKSYIAVEKDARVSHNNVHGRYYKLPLNAFIIKKHDTVFYDKDDIDKMLFVDADNGKYKDVNQEIQYDYETCPLNECKYVKKNYEIAIDKFKKRLSKNEEKYFFALNKVTCNNIYVNFVDLTEKQNVKK